MNDIRNKLEATEKKYRLLFDNPHDDIWILDLDSMTIIYSSSASQAIDGRTPEESIGQSLDQMITPDFMKVVGEMLEAEITLFKAGEHRTKRMQAELTAKDGSTFKADVDFRLFEDQGRLRVLGVTRNPFIERESGKRESELEAQLQEMMFERDRLRSELKILEGLLPICSNCRRIRDEAGNWFSLEEYIQSHSEADFTHTICPPCKSELYPFLEK
jgi:PAS domain S-box-containing protein